MRNTRLAHSLTKAIGINDPAHKAQHTRQTHPLYFERRVASLVFGHAFTYDERICTRRIYPNTETNCGERNEDDNGRISIHEFMRI